MKKTDFSFYPKRKRFMYEQLARSYRSKPQKKQISLVPFPQKLLESKIAFISVAGIYLKDQTPFTQKEQESNYDTRQIPLGFDPADVRILALDWDASEAQKDINVVFPVQNLVLLQKEGLIGELHEVSFSFSGHHEQQDQLDQRINKVIQEIKEGENNGVIVIPTSVATAETACLITRQIESAGIPTAMLTQFYEQALYHAPPRCAFINFPFGRPLGPANSVTLNTAILRDLLNLFEKVKVPGEILNLNFIWSYGEVPG